MKSRTLVIGGVVLAALLITGLLLSPILKQPDSESDQAQRPEGEPIGRFTKQGLLFSAPGVTAESDDVPSGVDEEDPVASEGEKTAPVSDVWLMENFAALENRALFNIHPSSKYDRDKHHSTVVKVSGDEYANGVLAIQKIESGRDPQDDRELYNMIRILVAHGAFKPAAALCERFIEAYPGSPLVFKMFVAWGQAKNNLGDVPGQIQVYEDFIARYPAQKKDVDWFKSQIEQLRSAPDWQWYVDNLPDLVEMNASALKSKAPRLRGAYEQAKKVPGGRRELARLIALLAKAGESQFITEQTADGSVQERVEATRLLEGQPDLLIQRLTDAHPYVRRQAATALGMAKHKPAVDGLVKMLRNDPVPDLRAVAARALGDIGGDPAVAALVAALASEDAEIRRGAIIGLGRVGSDAAKAALRTHKEQETDSELKDVIDANLEL